MNDQTEEKEVIMTEEMLEETWNVLNVIWQDTSQETVRRAQEELHAWVEVEVEVEVEVAGIAITAESLDTYLKSVEKGLGGKEMTGERTEIVLSAENPDILLENVLPKNSN